MDVQYLGIINGNTTRGENFFESTLLFLGNFASKFHETKSTFKYHEPIGRVVFRGDFVE